MLLLIDILDNKAADFIEMIKGYSYVKTKTLSAPDAALFKEISEIKNAIKNAGKVKAGKLKTRSVEELLNEL